MRSLAWLCFLAACGGESENLTGMYNLTLTNGENGCEYENWEVGEVATGVPITVTQVQGDSNVTVMVGGFAGLLVFSETGSANFTGTVDGANLEARIIGTKPTNDGNCTYTMTATIEATLSNDTLTGTIRYTQPTNDAPDCGDREQCRSVQNFNGTRPPAGP